MSIERTRIEVRNVGTRHRPVYSAFWNNKEVRASNTRGLDIKLDGIGAPATRDLHLIEDDE